MRFHPSHKHLRALCLDLSLALSLSLAMVLAWPAVPGQHRLCMAATDAPEVDVLSSGVFATDPGAPPATDLSNCPVNRMRLQEDRTDVRPDMDQTFGFVFSFSLPQFPQDEPVTLEARFMGSPNGAPSAANPLLAAKRLAACTGKPTFVGWDISQMGPPPSGQVTVEVYAGNSLLHSHAFHIGTGPAATSHDEAGTQLVTRIPGQGVEDAPQERTVQTATSNGHAWQVQVSCCLIRSNALEDAARLRNKGYDATVAEYYDRSRETTWHTVRLGGYPDRSTAERAAQEFIRTEGRDAYVVHR